MYFNGRLDLMVKGCESWQPALAILFLIVLLILGPNSSIKAEGIMRSSSEQEIWMGKDGKICNRDEIDSKYKWKPSDIFTDISDFEKGRQELASIMKRLADCHGSFSKDIGIIKQCLDLAFEGKMRLALLTVYASMKYHEDTRLTQSQGLKSTIDRTISDFAKETAFIEPELLGQGAEKLNLLAGDPLLEGYSQYLKNVARKKPHVLSAKEEELLAGSTIMAMSPYNIFTVFSTADMDYGEFIDHTGKNIKLSPAVYTLIRETIDRSDRKKLFETFFGAFNKFQHLFSAALSAQIESNIFYSRARNFSSELESALFSDNIPLAFYENLISSVNSYIPLLHRYLNLRKKITGIEDLRYYDLYIPISEKSDFNYDYESAVSVIVRALKPLGNEYLTTLENAMRPGSGWIDVFPNVGKKSGAYMTGEHYQVHPYVLLNFTGNYDSVSTLAHEMGHAMHSFYTNSSLPYSKSDYPIFTAEVASILNESILMSYELISEGDGKKKLFLLGESLEMFRTTVFRQAMFAEFELELYRAAERGEPLTSELISLKYLTLLKKYYGHNEHIVTIDDLYGIEWAYIPHFYYNFYVFQYVSGFIAANALAYEIMSSKDGSARERYIRYILKGGSTDYPLELLKNAGIDMLKTKPYAETMKLFAERLEMAENIFKDLKK